MKTKIQKMLKKSTYWTSFVVIGTVLGFSFQFVKAWTDPSVPPPYNNVDAPINVGGTTQSKSGGLNIGGNVGVGTVSPVYKLDVSGTTNATTYCISGANCISAWPGSQWVISGSDIYYNSGKVGIGTATPNNTFQVKDLINFDNAKHSTFIGYQSGNSNTALENTANGYVALKTNTTGFGNTANGAYALGGNTSGFGNTANGAQVLIFNTDGDDNTATGYISLYANTIGQWNTANGAQSLGLNRDGIGNTANGMGALNNNISGSYNTANGISALGVTKNHYNTGDGAWALYTNTLGFGNTGLGFEADVASNALTNATVIGYLAKVDASNKVRIGNTSVTKIEGQVAWSSASDSRLKHDVSDSDLGLDFINKLRPVSYKLNNGDGGTDYGFIAQEVESVIGKPTNIVMTDNTSEKMKSMRYDDLIAPLVKAVQEQQKQIDDLKAQVETLKNK